MREHYMLDGEGFLLVYSITERDSFKMIEAYHQQILRVKDTQAVPIVVVGNKSDLEGERLVEKVGTSRLHFSFYLLPISF
jgi:GTPase KRas protein